VQAGAHVVASVAATSIFSIVILAENALASMIGPGVRCAAESPEGW
jgi:hypothetical protein